MFDHHYSQTAAPYQQTITEHRAPTDESIRLHQEYEEKAWARVRESIASNLGNISVGLAVFKKTYSIRDLDTKLHCVVRINGEPVEFLVEQDDLSSSPESIITRILDALSKELASFVMHSLHPSQLLQSLNIKREKGD